jgi:hypothetical protein
MYKIRAKDNQDRQMTCNNVPLFSSLHAGRLTTHKELAAKSTTNSCNLAGPGIKWKQIRIIKVALL